MKNQINCQKNKENKRLSSPNIMEKYITVHRIKSKTKKIFPEILEDKENINKVNINEINDKFSKKKKIFLNTNIYSNNSTNNKNKINIYYKKNFIFFYPNELEDNNCNNNKNKKKNFQITHKGNNIGWNKGILDLMHTNSYFSPKTKNVNKINKAITTNYKSNKKINKIDIINNKIKKTYSSNEIKKRKNKINKTIKNFNLDINGNNKTHLMHRITKDTIFEKSNLNSNWFSTICSNINFLDYKPKKSNINKRNKNINSNESLNTIIIKRNNSALLTFGNANDDSSSESFSKENYINNNNFLLILKKENEILKNELKKTKEKVDVLETKIDNLIFQKNSNNAKINSKFKKEFNNKKISKNQINLKSSKSQTHLKYIKNEKVRINNNVEIKK